MTTQDIKEQLTELTVFFDILNLVADSIQIQAARNTAGEDKRRELVDRYQVLLSSLNTIQNKIYEVKAKATSEVPRSTEYILSILDKYGLAAPRQLNYPLNPSDPIIWSDDKSWIVDEIINNLKS